MARQALLCLSLLCTVGLLAEESTEKVKLSFRFDGISSLRTVFVHQTEVWASETPAEPPYTKISLRSWANVRVKHGEDAKVRLENEVGYFHLTGTGALEGTLTFEGGRWVDKLRYYSDSTHLLYGAFKEADNFFPAADILNRRGLSRLQGDDESKPAMWLWLPKHRVAPGDSWDSREGPVKASYRFKEVANVLGQRCALIEATVEGETMDQAEDVRYVERQNSRFIFSIDKGLILKAEADGPSEWYATATSPSPSKKTLAWTEIGFFETDAVETSRRVSEPSGWPQLELAWGPDGKFIAAREFSERGKPDNPKRWRERLTVWNAEEPRRLATSDRMPSRTIRGFSFSGDGKGLVVVSSETGGKGRIRLLDPRSLEEQRAAEFQDNRLSFRAAPMADGTMLVPTEDNAALLFDTETLESKRALPSSAPPFGLVSACPWKPGSLFLDLPDKVVLFDPAGSAMKVVYEGRLDFMAPGPEGILIRGFDDKQLQVVDADLRLKTVIPSFSVFGEDIVPWKVGYSADGSRIIVLWKTQELSVFDTSSWKEIAFLSEVGDKFTSFAWHPSDPRIFATGSDRGQLSIWQLGPR